VPALVIHTRQDAAIPLEEGRLLATLISDSRFVQLESRNHILLEQEPAWSRFLAEVRAFLGVGAETPDQPPPAQPVFPELTSRESVILELIAQGLIIPKSLTQVSPKTVRNHISHIFQS
jgi:DNA-binding NarL/FixJ family response regulator